MGIGFCGDYTMFSTAASIRLIQRRRYWAGMANAVGTLLVTITAAAAGLAVAVL